MLTFAQEVGPRQAFHDLTMKGLAFLQSRRGGRAIDTYDPTDPDWESKARAAGGTFCVTDFDPFEDW